MQTETSVGFSDNFTRLVTVSAGLVGYGSRSSAMMVVRVLDELDLGKLMMLTHQVTSKHSNVKHSSEGLTILCLLVNLAMTIAQAMLIRSLASMRTTVRGGAFLHGVGMWFSILFDFPAHVNNIT